MDFNSTGGMRSPFSPRVRQSITGRRPIGLSSAKKTQSNYMQSPGGLQSGDIIYKTPSITFQTYGLPLPVMVTEALTFASGEVSARMSSCGWCWVVAGRRLLTWPYQPTLAAAARELTLPQTDLAHKADLAVVFYENDDAQLPSCIGVSPEGVVRYWPCVGQEGVYVDVSAELAGQECERLGEPTRSGLVLATTTCTVVLLTPTIIDGRPTVTCRTLRPPSGWLGGIGRRVSLLFFGSMPAHADTRLVGVVMLSACAGGEEGEGASEGEDEGAGECCALVAGGPLLQLWRGAELADLHEHHLRRALCAHLAPQGDPNSLEIMALDVHASGPNSILLLIASVNVARSPEKRYAIAHVDVSQAASPRVVSVQPLQPLQVLQALRDVPPRCLPLPARVLLYCAHTLALVPGVGSSEKAECISVSSEGDRILGAALCDGVPLVFSRRHGVLALAAQGRPGSLSDSPMSSPSASDMYDGNLTMYEIDPHELVGRVTDACGRLQTAFLLHLRRDAGAARLLADTFGAGAAGSGALARAALSALRRLLDDAPAGDPRWGQARAPRAARAPRPRLALGASAALQLQAQLRDKARVFALFLDFLRAHAVWQRIAALPAERGWGAASVQRVACVYGARLCAARALRSLHEQGAPLLDVAVNQVARGAESEEWNGSGSEPESDAEAEAEAESAALRAGELSDGDVAFRRVTRAHLLLRALARVPAPTPADAHAALALLVSVLSEVQTWTLARACADTTLRARLLEAAAALADLLLAAQQQHTQQQHSHQHAALRRDLIRPYVEIGQTRRAAALAEKFQEWELLVQLCVDDGDLPRLHALIDKYAHEGMAEIAFAWLASGSGAKRALLVREFSERGGQRLERWLRGADEPTRVQLLALQRLAARQHAAAAHALARLAPTHGAATCASLAKLCLLASDEAEERSSDTWRQVERVLALSELQAALPAALRAQDVAAPDAPLAEPEQLLQLYIDSESKSLTEYDYKTALDLTEFIEDEDQREELRLQVWSACVAQEPWEKWERSGAELPADALRDSTLYRLADLVHLMGGDVEQSLPELQALLGTPRLERRASEPRFQFALRLVYELIRDAHH
ncbi:unnamed protein product [Parnassius apollo]|uniref:(apollo) hypothetical protein n=1 Tax=Parnassius apollo TaxID=110799 RepID=A0A8S3VZS5_PARAO|nr:unnamed protein product [Parnassius apollo]